MWPATALTRSSRRSWRGSGTRPGWMHLSEQLAGQLRKFRTLRTFPLNLLLPKYLISLGPAEGTGNAVEVTQYRKDRHAPTNRPHDEPVEGTRRSRPRGLRGFARGSGVRGASARRFRRDHGRARAAGPRRAARRLSFVRSRRGSAPRPAARFVKIPRRFANVEWHVVCTGDDARDRAPRFDSRLT